MGRKGRNIGAMRTIISAASAANGTGRTSLEIIELEEDAYKVPEPYSAVS